MKSNILIRNLCVYSRIGIYDWEIKKKQSLRINIFLYFSIKKSSKSDNIKDTVDYEIFIKKIKKYTLKLKTNLIECFSIKIVKWIFNNYPLINKVILEIKKDKFKDISLNLSVKRKISSLT